MKKNTAKQNLLEARNAAIIKEWHEGIRDPLISRTELLHRIAKKHRILYPNYIYKILKNASK